EISLGKTLIQPLIAGPARNLLSDSLASLRSADWTRPISSVFMRIELNHAPMPFFCRNVRLRKANKFRAGAFALGVAGAVAGVYCGRRLPQLHILNNSEIVY